MTFTFVSRKTNTRKMTIRGERAKSTVEYGETVFKLNRPSVHTVHISTDSGGSRSDSAIFQSGSDHRTLSYE
jgi:hypothetical protein